MQDDRVSRTPLWRQPVLWAAGTALLLVVGGVGWMIYSSEELDEQLNRQAALADDHGRQAKREQASTGSAGHDTRPRDPEGGGNSTLLAGEADVANLAALPSHDEGGTPTTPPSDAKTAKHAEPATVPSQQPPPSKPADPVANAPPAERPKPADPPTAGSPSPAGPPPAEPPKRVEPQPAVPSVTEPPPAEPEAPRGPSWLKCNENGEPYQVTLANGTVLALDTYGDEYEGYDYRPPMTLYDRKLHKLIDFKHVHGHGTAVSHLRFDAKRNRMFWTWTFPPHHVGKILGADLEGRGIVNLVTDLESIGGFTIDPSRKKLYWTERKSLVDSVKSANLDGSNVQDIVPGAEGGGMAVEPESGDVFYYTQEGGTSKRSINRIKADGSEETEIIKDPYVVGSATQIIIEPVSRKLYWRSGDGSIRRANYDGSSAEFVVDAMGVGHGGNFALDSGHQKVYWTSSSYMELCRANFDGSQTEVLLVSPPELENPNHREISYVAFEPEHRRLYVSWYYFEGAPPAIGVLSRMEIPPFPKPLPKPAPPWIASVSPPKQAAGGEVVLKGKGFDGASKVALFDDGNGHEVPAQFEVRSDSELAFTMPKLSEGCSHAAVIIVTPGGVTVTLPITASLAKPNIWVPLPGTFDISTDFVTGKYANVWYVQGQTKRMFNVSSQATKTWNGGGIKSLIYAENGSIVSTKERGNNVLFLKDGAITGMSRWRTVIYHEPFAVINNSFRKSAKETETTLVAVPAIRPSFVESLLEYEE